MPTSPNLPAVYAHLPRLCLSRFRCGANSAQIRQSRPDSGLGYSHFQANIFQAFQVVPFSLGCGQPSSLSRLNKASLCPEPQSYLTESVYQVVLQKSIPAQIRQLVRLHYSCKVAPFSLGSGQPSSFPSPVRSNHPFQVRDVYWPAPKSGDLWHKSRRLNKTICSHSQADCASKDSAVSPLRFLLQQCLTPCTPTP